jgi:limonene-1,2-epoxide hydrolase
MTDTDAPHERYRRFLETLTPDSLGALDRYVTGGVRFKDPFNDVRGAEAMARVFRHMFENVADVRFRVHHMALAGDTCLMAWRFEGRLGSGPWTFDGASVVRFTADGRVCEHIDHWDAARDFYERLPVIGRLLAWLRGRLATR